MGSHVEVILKEEDNLQRPFCLHGPTVLFREVGTGPENFQYYACSLYRDGRQCKFRMTSKEWKQCKDTEVKNEKIISVIRKRNLSDNSSKKIERNFCQTCGKFISKMSLSDHSKHEVMRRLSLQAMEEIQDCPSKFLQLKENDKGEAQYIFSAKTLQFLENLLGKQGFTKILCIGTPTLHATVSRKMANKGIKSFLLDIDDRYRNFFNEEEFVKFNMVNCYFYERQEGEKSLNEFLKQKESDRVGIFLDPPFGCRTELLGECLRYIQNLSRQINGDLSQILAIFLIFPYFMENYVRNEMPQLEMMDYKVNYDNHGTFHDAEDAGRFGSPVRIFTNALASLVELPTDEGYRECKICSRWVARDNSHCSICQKCPSKNGGRYKHCSQCGLCVKSFYKHCHTCNRCTQESGHQCKEYQRNASCWICRRRGHLEQFCPLRRKKGKMTKYRICGICLKKNHSELICSKRTTILREECFLGKYTIASSSQ